jgi:hypothetical protein
LVGPVPARGEGELDQDHGNDNHAPPDDLGSLA